MVTKLDIQIQLEAACLEPETVTRIMQVVSQFELEILKQRDLVRERHVRDETVNAFRNFIKGLYQ